MVDRFPDMVGEGRTTCRATDWRVGMRPRNVRRDSWMHYVDLNGTAHVEVVARIENVVGPRQ